MLSKLPKVAQFAILWVLYLAIALLLSALVGNPLGLLALVGHAALGAGVVIVAIGLAPAQWFGR